MRDGDRDEAVGTGDDGAGVRPGDPRSVQPAAAVSTTAASTATVDDARLMPPWSSRGHRVTRSVACAPGTCVAQDVVTGAGRGIGRGLALGPAAHGYDVALVGRTAAHLEVVATEVADQARSAGVAEEREVPFAEDDVDDVWRVVETNLRDRLRLVPYGPTDPLRP